MNHERLIHVVDDMFPNFMDVVGFIVTKGIIPLVPILDVQVTEPRLSFEAIEEGEVQVEREA